MALEKNWRISEKAKTAKNAETASNFKTSKFNHEEMQLASGFVSVKGDKLASEIKDHHQSSAAAKKKKNNAKSKKQGTTVTTATSISDSSASNSSTSLPFSERLSLLISQFRESVLQKLSSDSGSTSSDKNSPVVLPLRPLHNLQMTNKVVRQKLRRAVTRIGALNSGGPEIHLKASSSSTGPESLRD